MTNRTSTTFRFVITFLFINLLSISSFFASSLFNGDPAINSKSSYNITKLSDGSLVLIPNDIKNTCLACDNVTNGGEIAGDETGCANPTWDPGLIFNVIFPSGGTGAIEYVWMYTTDDPSLPIMLWNPVPNSNSPDLDPTPITQTTYYTRCSRRAGCTLYVGETNIVVKKVECCDNPTNPGTIGYDQSNCGPFVPAKLVNVISPSGGSGALQYIWKYSFTGGPVDSTWLTVPNAFGDTLNPSLATQTIYYARLVRRFPCPDYINSNIIKITVNPPLTIETKVSNVPCYGGNTGSIVLTINGGTPPFTYLWSNGLPATKDQVNLTAGTYSVTVTDSKGCSDTETIQVHQPNDITLSETHTNINCTGGLTGSINLTVAGGVSPYTYLWSNGSTTEDISGLGAGVYSVTVTDKNGCTKVLSGIIISQPALIVLSVSVTNPKCNGGTDGSINLTVTGGTAPYTYNWDNAPDVQDPSGLGAGTYNVTVTDALGCTKTISATLIQPPPIVINVSVTNIPCNGTNTGSINLTVSGGTPGYTYNWDNAPDVEDPSGLGAGTYNVTVTDVNGCTKTASATITQPPVINITVVPTNVKCNGGNDGSINLTVTGGTAPYTYNWDNAPDVEDPSGLTAGTYNVTITDANGCTKTASATITQPPLLVLTAVPTNIPCNGGATGSINLTISGGTAPYTINWDNAPDVEDPSGLAAGTYNVTVTDANGCSKTTSATITQPPLLVLTAVPTNVLCNGGSTGSINLTVSGGTAPYTFNWDNASDVEDPSGLAAGTYNVTVTDANGCSKTASATINQPPVINITGVVTNVLCGGSTGSIDVTVTGGTAPYSYNWDNAPDVEDPSGLTAGTYNLTVTDANGCTKTFTATITQPTNINIAVVVTNVKCNGGNDGSINLTVSGGTPPYTYNWDNAPDVEDPSGLSAGTYNVTVTDLNSCSKTASVTITQPPLLVLTAVPTNIPCNGGSTGSINLTISGGTAPYAINWDNAPDVEDPSGLTAGTYNVTVTDANACSKSTSVTITQAPLLVISGTVTNVLCNGASTGSINTTVSGGTAPYSFNWDNAPDVEDPSGLAAGTYNLTVTDANGCSKTFTATITQPPVINITVVPTNVKCNSGNDGSINLTVTGGTAPYTYNWDNAPDVEDPSGLTAGTYNVTVTDANGCTKTASATITQPPLLVLTAVPTNIPCNGGATGSINLTISGGTAPYTINWDNAPDVEDPSGLAAGTYNVTVTDANGCSKTTSATITQPPLLVLTAVPTNVLCNGGATGSINLTVSGGTAPYTFNWDNAPDVEDPSGLAAGTYNVTVTDANGCSKTASATINQPPVINITGVVTNVLCGGSTGSIDVTVTGGTAPYSYNWDNAPDVEDPSGLTAGTYNLTVTDANGCTKTFTATITQPTNINIAVVVTNVKCNGGNDGSINLTVSGGTPPYTYNWDNAPDVEDPSGLSAGTYNVTVTDVNSCSKTASVTITQPPLLVLTAVPTNIPCNGGSTGSINLTISGGTAPYAINWDNAPDVEDPSGLTAGTYSVTVTDANGCSKSTSVTVTQAPLLVISGTVTNVLCNGASTGSINTTVSGGTAPYSFNWDNAPDVEDPSGLAAGTYNLTVTDANGCSKTFTATITQPPVINITVVPTNVKCNGGNDGSINLTVTGGTAPYTYNWDNAPDVEDPSGLTAGTYNVTVTDANGCSKTASTTITQPNLIVLTITTVNVKCNGGTDGSINLTVSGGTAPYTYKWSHGFTGEDPVAIPAGFYQVTVTDANGCTKTASGNITDPGPISINVVATNVKCTGGNDGSINLTVTGGTAPYSFNWDNAPDVEDPSGLTAGTYNVTVTDANGCSKTASATISAPTPIVITAVPNTIPCNGGNSGTINLTVSGGTPVYTFNWDNAPDVEDPTGLTAGVYNVTVTDANGCTKTATVTINEATTLAVTATVTNLNCNGANTGSINLTVTGGTAPYSFNWDNAPDVEDPSGLAAGTYNVTVTDSQGCSKLLQVTITQPSPINITVSVTNTKCKGSLDGSINLTITGGTAPYSINWNNAPDVEDPSGLGAGTYSVTVTDANGCTKTATATITEPADLVITSTVTNPLCNGVNTGSINLTVTGGTPPYSFNWDNAPDVEDPSGLAAGTYNVTVSDANACTKTASVTITQPTSLNVTTVVTNVKCNGGNTGSINTTVTGGTAPYTYNWDNAPDVEDPSGLTAGTYNLTVTDANGCTKTATATITEPPALVITVIATNVKCNGGNTGSINLTVSGGTAPYTFNWDNAPDVEDPSGLGAGTYNVTVTDANGCSKTQSATITQPPVIIISVQVTNVVCKGGNTGSINLTVSGGTAPYSYNWDNAPDVEDPSGLTAGTYNVTVTDANGCTKTTAVTITEAPALSLAVAVSPVKCYNGNTGAINLTVTGGTAPYSFNWDNAPDVEDPTGLAAGTYKVTVTDANGCTATTSASLVNPPDLLITFVVTNCTGNGNNGSIDVTVTGGTPPYSYNWDNAPDVQDPTGLSGGIYKLTVTDSQGCSKTITAEVKCDICVNVTNGGTICCDEVLCGPGSKASIIYNVTLPTGGVGNLVYVWMYSTQDPFFYLGNPDWYPVPNSNAPSLDPGILYETTYFVRCVRRDSCIIFAGESNIVTKEVLAVKPVAQIIEHPSGPLCKEEYANFAALPNPGLMDPVYAWTFGAGGNPINGLGQSISTFWTIPGIKIVKLTVTEKGVCPATAQFVVQVNDCFGGKIKIVNFNAIVNQDQTVTLDWNSINMDQKHHFRVQRSADGKNFSDIYQVDGQLNYIGFYQYIDQNPIRNIGYYRILITEEDGDISLSDTKRVDLDNINNDKTYVYPNPFSYYLDLEHDKAPTEELSIELFDYTGKKLYSKSSANKTEHLEIRNLINGNYMLIIRDSHGNIKSTHKLIKQND